MTAEIEFSCVDDFLTFINSDYVKGWIFRGVQSYSFSLDSKLERIFKENTIAKECWETIENESINYFKSNFPNNQITPSDNDRLGWLSLMQHYGAPTRLTDWSFSPFISLYFAFERIVEDENFSALWLLNAYLIKREFGFVAGDTSNLETEKNVRDENWLLKKTIEKKIELPLPLINFNPDERMKAQHACFVSVGVLGIDPPPIEKFMTERLIEEYGLDALLESGRYYEAPNQVFWLKNPKNLNEGLDFKHYLQIPKNLIYKIKLPYSWREQILFEINKLGINSTSIYPGKLDKLGKDTATFIIGLLKSPIGDQSCRVHSMHQIFH